MRTMTSAVLFALLGTVLGCQSLPWQQDNLPPVELLEEEGSRAGTVTPPPPKTGLEMASGQRFRDVPLPAKAKEDRERSFIYESASLQVGRMVYTIRASVNDLAQFYIDHCPAADWQRISTNEASGGVTMVFTKPGKRLEVSVVPIAPLSQQRLILQLIPDQPSGTVM